MTLWWRRPPHTELYWKIIASKQREVIILFHSAFLRPHLKHWFQFAPQKNENIDILDQGQRRAVKTIRVLENKMCKERLIKLGLFSLRREGSFKKPYLGLEEGILLLSTSPQWEHVVTAEPDSWRCPVMEWEGSDTNYSARNPSYVQGKMFSPWGQPNVGAGPREVGASLALEIFKTQLNKALKNLAEWETPCVGAWTR